MVENALKRITRVALALFVGALIVCEPEGFGSILGSAIKVFGKEAARLEAKKH